MHVVLESGGDQTVARVFRVAGLDAGGGLIVIARIHDGIGVDETVGVLQFAGVGFVRRRHGTRERVADRHEQLMLHGLARDDREIGRRGIVFLIGHAVGIDEVRFFAAQLGSPAVHAIDKGGDAAGDGRGDHVAGLVRRGDHGAVQIVLKRHLLARDDSRGAGLLIHPLQAVVAGCDLGLEIDLAALHSLDGEQHREDLCQARGIGARIRITRVIDDARIQIHQQRVARGDLRCLHNVGSGIVILAALLFRLLGLGVRLRIRGLAVPGGAVHGQNRRKKRKNDAKQTDQRKKFNIFHILLRGNVV